MRERELKFEWSHWVAEGLTATEEMESRDKEAKSTERVRDEWRSERELKFGVWMKWAEVGFVIKFKRSVLHFFFFLFFFFFFWILAWIGHFSCFARYGPSWPDSTRIGPSLSRVGASQLKKKKKKKKHVAICGLTHEQRHPCVAASNAGVAPLAPQPCFPD